MKIPIIDDFIHMLDWEKEPVKYSKLALSIYIGLTSCIILGSLFATYMVFHLAFKIENILALLAMYFVSLMFVRMTQYLTHLKGHQPIEKA